MSVPKSGHTEARPALSVSVCPEVWDLAIYNPHHRNLEYGEPCYPAHHTPLCLLDPGTLRCSELRRLA